MIKIEENSVMNEIVKKGWNVLVENLGIADATRFIVSFERGIGDSVQEIKKFWGEKKIEDIHAQILEAKKKGLI
jgi:hypothetical protein